MKKLFLLTLVLALFLSCQNQPQRYFESSPQIDKLISGIEAYEAGDFEAWKSHFADTAKIHHNSLKGASKDEVASMLSGMVSNLSSYGFSKDNAVFEMIEDKDGKTWVNYWNAWKGTTKVTNKEIIIPVHITAEFVEDKIVNEHVYYNPSELQEAIAEVINMPDNEKTILTNIESFVEDFLNKKDDSVLENILADDFMRFHNDTKVATGAEELKANLKPFFNGFPDLNIELLHKSTVVNNAIFVHWKFTGTHTGEFAETPATGKEVSVNGLSRLQFNDSGKMIYEHLYFDQLPLMQQIGKTLN
ncbi:nuclear transport factor 2 family protein [Seonamhaeicola sp. ML3]|uniref:nuclear transport factor 2 family protein n=1 Tax=Seonamhaeicola sp. ML3 TaxID=2937786 RepID=UPI00200FDB10|nr:nuclear transport factor 2 family protein [Seonamhaeicola sp. ML3]